MIWIVSTLCFAVGLCAGAVLFKQFKSDAAKVEQLEKTLADLQMEHDTYKNSVHSHFSDTATLVNNLADSYREVYNQLAVSANALCPESISSQLSLSGNSADPLLKVSSEGDDSNSAPASPFPPRDYAVKTDPEQKGNLSEDYGFDQSNKI